LGPNFSQLSFFLFSTQPHIPINPSFKMAFGTLFTRGDNPRATAIKAVAKANNLELNIVEAPQGSPSIEHLKAHGLGKIPAFLGEDGFALSECIAVAIYGMSFSQKLSDFIPSHSQTFMMI
jgi:hypothetical protein